MFKQIAKYDPEYIKNKLLMGPICQSEFKGLINDKENHYKNIKYK